MSRTCHKLTHPLVKYISEEKLSLLKTPTDLISDPDNDYNYVVVGPCWDQYPEGYYWGDYIDYRDSSRIGSVGVNNQQLLANLTRLLEHQSGNCRFNVHVFYVSAQRFNLDFKNKNFTFIELPEYYGEYWQVYKSIHPDDSGIGVMWNSKTHHFCNFNKRPDLFRQQWFYEVLDNLALKSTTNFSYVCEDPRTRQTSPREFINFHAQSGRTESPDAYLKMLPYYTDAVASIRIKTAQQYGWEIPIETIKQSLIWVVNETFFDHPWDPVFTEKIFKPMYFQMPFILFSNAGSLKELRSLGFKTFSGLIDESYDYEFDNQLRFNMVVNECKRLSNIPLADLIDAVKEFEPVLAHNHNRMKELHAELAVEIPKIDNFISTHIKNQTLLGY